MNTQRGKGEEAGGGGGARGFMGSAGGTGVDWPAGEHDSLHSMMVTPSTPETRERFRVRVLYYEKREFSHLFERGAG